MAASNRPGVIELALRRPGRFDRELNLGIPVEQGRLKILQIKTRDMRLGPDVDLEILARRSHGFVGADLQQLCMEAALQCIREQMGAIDFDKDRVDKKVLDSILVEMRHFEHAMGVVHPSSLRESAVSGAASDRPSCASRRCPLSPCSRFSQRSLRRSHTRWKFPTSIGRTSADWKT